MSEEELVDNAAATTANSADKAEATTASDEKDIANDESGDGLLNNLERDFNEYKLETEGEEVEEPEGDEPEEDKPEPKAEDPAVIETRATQKRFDEFAQEIRELRSENDKLKQKAPIDTSSILAPNPDDYEDGEDDKGYIAAKGAHDGSITALNLVNQNQHVENQRQAALENQNKINAYGRKAESVRIEIKDFDTVMRGTMLDAVDANNYYTPAALALLEIENGPKVAYHIASNPDLALILNRSTPTQASLKIGELSAQLSAVPHKRSKAPPPVGSEDKGGGSAAANDGLRNIKGAKFY